MTVTTLTSCEFDQDLAKAKRAAGSGPVVITDRGRPAHVLLSIEAYCKLAGERRSLLDAMSMKGLSETDFDPPHIGPDIPSVELY